MGNTTDTAASAVKVVAQVAPKMPKGIVFDRIVISLSTKAVALLSPQGFSLRGKLIDTDLKPGVYEARVNPRAKQWEFKKGQVKSGQRFEIEITGPDPFSLAWAWPITVEAWEVSLAADADLYEKLKEEIQARIDAKEYAEAFLTLASLNHADLEEYVARQNEESQGPIMALLARFQDCADAGADPMRLLAVLESALWKPEQLYIDGFSKYYVDKTSFSRDKAREAQGKWNVKIIFHYGMLSPERAITVYADDILDAKAPNNGARRIGPGALFYPEHLNQGTVPRMWAAKKDIIKTIEAQNIEFIIGAWMASDNVIGAVMMGQGFLSSTLKLPTPGKSSEPFRATRRPVSDAWRNEPGRWYEDFEGGANMSPEASRYEARVCNKDESITYYRNGVKFDGYEGGSKRVLVDAKYWQSNHKMVKAMEYDAEWVKNSLRKSTARQIAAAGDIPIEWRVSSQRATDMLKNFFEAEGINIKVVFVP